MFMIHFTGWEIPEKSENATIVNTTKHVKLKVGNIVQQNFRTIMGLH